MEGKTLVNVVKCYIENEKTNERFDIADTASEVDVEPILNEGKRDILRVKNRILAVNETEDIVIGYKLKLKDNTFNIKVMEIVDGGHMEGNKYVSIPAGQVVDKPLFTLEVITEEKDYSRTTGYTKFTWKHCKGKVPKFSIKDGEFIVPEFEAESIPFRGETPVEIEFINSLEPTPETPEIPLEDIGVEGDKVEDSNTDVGVAITNRVIWTFKEQINQDDVTKDNFTIKRKSDNSVVQGSITIDTTKKIVTFVPTSLTIDTVYIAEAKAVNKLDTSGKTTALSTEFKTIKIK
ncbi:Ig-like domain-containing protein [uncultured Clostridium sp.]|uniref:Ig-like domain-containing protein n=1 Tax=uncultured Clostridium sp. TaxID=59620 RepID=UPI0028E96CF4|nr:Ig-like domain-containing protein [uncultured Clostridium sp.]